MTSKLVVNTIEADTGISSVSFASSISMDSTSKFHFSAAGIDIGADTNINRPAAGVLGFNINSSEKARIDSSGRLLLGTTTEGAADADDFTIGTSTNSAGITIRTNTSGTGRLWFSDGTSGDAEYQGYIQYDHNNQILSLGSGGSTRLRIASGGEVSIGGFTPTAGAGILQIGGGLRVAGSGSASDTTTPYIYRTSGVDNLNFATSGVERLRITSDGQLLYTANKSNGYTARFVQANSSNPAWIEIDSPADNNLRPAYIQLQNAGTNKWGIGQVYQSTSSGAFHIAAGAQNQANSKLTITTAGKVGIGTAIPVTNLDVRGSSDASITIGLTNGTKYGNFSCDNSSTYLYAYNGNDIIFSTHSANSFNRKVTIKNDGDIGVGVASPDGRFHIMGGNLGGAGSVTANSAGDLLVLESNQSNGMSILVANDERANIYFGTTGTNGDIEAGIQYAHESVSTTADRRSMIFRSGGGERMRIQNQALRVGDATHQNAGGRLQVVEERGGQQYNDCNVYFETNANDWNLKTYYNSAGSHYHIVFIEQGATRGAVLGNDGSNVTFQQGSDYRWKENIVDMTGTEGIEICKKLKPRKYNWIENREATGQINTVDGFIAHEVEESGVLGAVTGEKDAVNEDGSIKGQMLDYGQMTPVLAAAIKGLITKVETLEAEVAALKGS